MVSINMFKEETIKREVDMTYPKDLLEKFYKGFIESNNILIPTTIIKILINIENIYSALP